MNPHASLALAQCIVWALILCAVVLGICIHFFTPGTRRIDTGWYYIMIFLLFKTVGSALIVHVQTVQSSVDLIVAATILGSVALTPLLSAGLGFTNTAASDPDAKGPPSLTLRILRLSHIVTTTALILGIVGGSQSASIKTTADAHEAVKFTRIASLLFLAALLLLTLTIGMLDHTGTWSNNRRKTLGLAVAVSIPFLAVRVVYAILGAFNTNSDFPRTTYNRFNPVSGSVGIAVIMGFLMELVVIVLYASASMWVQRLEKLESRRYIPCAQNLGDMEPER